MSGFRRPVLAVTLLVSVATTATVAAATSGTPVGPRQWFAGLVNGRTGAAGAVTIRMACAGPVTPGQTGHPAAGQTVAVRRTASGTGRGYTGASATGIGVFFGPPPPSATGGEAVTLRVYGEPRPIPTSLTLPCSGTGTVTFVPLPMSPPTSRSVGVPVRFLGQP